MIIDTAKYTSSGGHQINEDTILCGTDLYIVADGLGGHYGGENASAAAVNYIAERYRGDISDNEIERLLEGANSAVNKLDNDSHTTLAAAFVSGERIRIANVGDSRVYLFRSNKVYTVTKDHSVCQVAVDMGEMSYEYIRFSDDRSRLLKVLGDEGALNLKTKYEPIELYDGDAFLLCSDGFWEYVHEREMEADLLKADSAESWKRLMLKRHLLKAKNEGDNYSLVCGIVHSERKPAAMPIPVTIAVNGINEQHQKSRRGFLIVLLLLLFAALLTAFWIMGGSKLFSDGSSTSSNDSVDISLSETVESETHETKEHLLDESDEQPLTTTEDAVESVEEPSLSTSEAPEESIEEPSATTESAFAETTEQEPTETEEQMPTVPEEQLPDETEVSPSSTSYESTEPAEPELLLPIQTGIPSIDDDQIEPVF